MPRRRVSPMQLLGLVALAGLAVPLVALAVQGWYSRYAADDYCTAGVVEVAGLLKTQSMLYTGWSGRFAATLLVTLVELGGARAVQLLPTVALLVWLVSATWAIRAVATASGWRLGLLYSALLAALVAYATLETTADMPQVLHWQTGTLTYLSSLVLATVYIGWVARAVTCPRGPIGPAVCFALALVAGGTSETFAAAQVAAHALALGMAVLAGQRSRRSGLLGMLVAGSIGGGLALVIIALSPGNEVRQPTASRAPLSVALPDAVDFTLGWLRLTFARPHASVLALLVGVPAAIAATAVRAGCRPSTGRWLATTVLTTAVLIFACMLPAFYALGSNPPGRAQVIPQYVLVSSVALIGWLAGAHLARFGQATVSGSHAGRSLAAGLLVLVGLVGLGPLVSAAQVARELRADRAYAAAWDELDGRLRAEQAGGVQDATIAPLPSTGTVQNLDFVGPDRADWFNVCVARYYALHTIAADS